MWAQQYFKQQANKLKNQPYYEMICKCKLQHNLNQDKIIIVQEQT